jgi:hypothetical protein
MKHTVWARLGIDIELDKPMEAFVNEEELMEAAAKSIKARRFKINGEAYTPENCLPDGKFDGGDMEIGEFYENEKGEIQ